MTLKSNVAFIGLWMIMLVWNTTANAFMGDYMSIDGEDMAFIINIKSSDTEYKSDGDDSGDIDRRTLSLGLSKSVSPLIKIFGSFNYTFDGELPINFSTDNDGSADLESGYGLSAGGSYLFWEQELYSVQGYGRFNYIFEETFKYSGGNIDFTFDGYELLLGVMGTYRLLPELEIYAAFQLVPYSDFSMDIDGLMRDEWDLERDQILGIKCGALYDFQVWFVKGEVEFISERAFGIVGGVKF